MVHVTKLWNYYFVVTSISKFLRNFHIHHKTDLQAIYLYSDISAPESGFI